MKRRGSIVGSASGSTSRVAGSVANVTPFPDRVAVGRIAFLLCLLATAAILGFVAHFSISRSEESLSLAQFDGLVDQYDSIADRALVAALGINVRKRLGSISLASIVAYALPDADAWPFVAVPGFEQIAGHLLVTSSSRELALSPFVTPDQLSDFEDFAYNFFENVHDPPFPNGTGTSSFGRGVWGVNKSLGTSDNRYHITEPYTNSPYRVHSPVFQHNLGAAPGLMLDMRFEPVRVKMIDDIINCANLRVQSAEIEECGSISPFIYLATQNASLGPGAIFLEPVFPANNITKMTGMIASPIVWNEVLQDVFSSNVEGIVCVLETDTQVYSYNIVHGEAIFVGEGDFHETEFDFYRRSISLTPDKYFSSKSANYTLSIYPTSAFFKVYNTNNALLVTTGTVCIILFVSVLFFVYDGCVRRDINAKSDLLEAKRAFVRFVSHEVRTPLNSVCMGMTLMQEEMVKSIGCKSIEELKIKTRNDELHPESTSHDSAILACFRLSTEIEMNVLRSVSVLNDLLNYDKIEMGKLNLELKVVPFRRLVESTVTEFRVAAAQKKLELTVDFSQVDEALMDVSDQLSNGPRRSYDCRTIGDDIRLRQVMRNLISNAIKFTPQNGEIRVCACWSTSRRGKEGQVLHKFTLNDGEEVSVPRCGWIKVMVIDSGAGMTPEQVQKVFGAGVQFNANELQGGHGTGLGLHIAKGIMEQHGGSLSVTSQGLGHGSTFTMKIPIHNMPESPDESMSLGLSQREMDAEIHTDFEPTTLKILVVDDATMNRKLLARLLRNSGHECDEADDGDVAVRLVKEAMDKSQPYDTVLLDNEMPVMSGSTAAEHMRAMGSDVFIVGVTGNLLPEDVAHFKESGANAVLPKPFKLSDLETLWMEYGVFQCRNS